MYIVYLVTLGIFGKRIHNRVLKRKLNKECCLDKKDGIVVDVNADNRKATLAK